MRIILTEKVSLLLPQECPKHFKPTGIFKRRTATRAYGVAKRVKFNTSGYLEELKRVKG